MKLQEAIDDLIRRFEAAGMEHAKFEARQTVQECLDLTFAQLMSQPDRELEAAAAAKLSEWGAKRAQGLPLAYLSGRRGFYKYEFMIETGVLVPRPETEMVVETALRRMEERPSCLTVADLGCGSGCIGLSLLSEMTDLRLWAVDVSPKACEITWRNAVRLGVQERVKVENKKVTEWDPGLQFDVIVANPPYIGSGDTRVQAHVRLHEPQEALFAGEDGLAAISEWIPWAYRHLKGNGILVCEIGADQGRQVQDLFGKAKFQQIQLERDLAGLDRVVSGVRGR